jgi:multidrug efflux pump subunit AcrA (membrane-fusion protein)
MNTLETNPASIASPAEPLEHSIPQPIQRVRLGRIAIILAVLIVIGAVVRRLEETQGFQRVVAPFAGIITARNVDIGDLISVGGARELFHIAQMEALRVYVRVPQTQAADIRPGQAAELLIPELPSEPFPAKVTTTSEAVSNTSRTLLTELQVDNSQGRIRIGSYAQVRASPASPPRPRSPFRRVCSSSARKACKSAS